MEGGGWFGKFVYISPLHIIDPPEVSFCSKSSARKHHPLQRHSRKVLCSLPSPPPLYPPPTTATPPHFCEKGFIYGTRKTVSMSPCCHPSSPPSGRIRIACLPFHILDACLRLNTRCHHFTAAPGGGGGSAGDRSTSPRLAISVASFALSPAISKYYRVSSHIGVGAVRSHKQLKFSLHPHHPGSLSPLPLPLTMPLQLGGKLPMVGPPFLWNRKRRPF